MILNLLYVVSVNIRTEVLKRWLLLIKVKYHIGIHMAVVVRLVRGMFSGWQQVLAWCMRKCTLKNLLKKAVCSRWCNFGLICRQKIKWQHLNIKRLKLKIFQSWHYRIMQVQSELSLVNCSMWKALRIHLAQLICGIPQWMRMLPICSACQQVTMWLSLY